jgi:phage tail-like protein
MSDVEEAVAVFFSVSIDGHKLGAFLSCEGLGLEVVVEQREEGGNNGWVWQLPTRIKYTNIKLSRPVTKDTNQIAVWISSLSSGVKRSTATIEARNAERTVIAQWGLDGVIPVRWTGPQLSVDSPKLATETLELAHHGFLSTLSKGQN